MTHSLVGHLLIGATAFLAAFSAPIHASSTTTAADLNKDNAALIQHIKSTDLIFQAVLGKCKNETLRRSNRGGLHYFAYSGTCVITPTPEEDCGAYKVKATGTVDTPQSATVRDIRLVLQCSA